LIVKEFLFYLSGFWDGRGIKIPLKIKGDLKGISGEC
jgi:hypothetical protein